MSCRHAPKPFAPISAGTGIFADSIFELYSELELQQLLSQFFEQPIYYASWGTKKQGSVLERRQVLRLRGRSDMQGSTGHGALSCGFCGQLRRILISIE